MRKIRRFVALRPQGPGEPEEPAESAVLAAFVVRDHAPDGPMGLEQGRRGGRRDHVQRAVAAGERLEQRRREDDVSKEGGLDDEASQLGAPRGRLPAGSPRDRKSTRLNSSHLVISYAVFCLKKKKKNNLITESHNT